MDPDKRARLEAAGYVAIDPYDWLGLTPEERELVDLQVRLVGAFQRARDRLGLTRRQMAKRTGLTVKQVADIDAGGFPITLDQFFRSLFALGVTLADVLPPAAAPAKPARRRKKVPA